LLYSHDALGLGHMRRNLAIARALVDADPAASVLLATSADEVERFGLPPRTDVLKLPGLCKLDNERYVPRRLVLSFEQVRELRASLLAAAVDSFRPAVVLADKHPLGASGELRQALDVQRAAGGKAVVGLRDVLDAPATVREEWAAREVGQRIEEYDDRLLVYGERAVFDPLEAYELSDSLAERTTFCGYVRSPGSADRRAAELEPRLPVDRHGPSVLATAGGGEDGFGLLSMFVEAAAESKWRGVAVVGPQSSEAERRKLSRLARRAGIALRTFVPGLAASFSRFDALVCMGGYNTLVEALASSTPTVCTPRVRPRSEQLIRSRSFASLGLLRIVEPGLLDADALRSEVDEALATPREEVRARTRATLRLDGARRAADCLIELAESAGPPRQVAAAQ
jgi:predicted glycosyltransferase